jgi:hypothetical protein
MIMAINQLVVSNERSPFKDYLEYRKIRNKEYILNEIYKLQLLLKIYFLKYAMNNTFTIKPIPTNIDKLIDFYKKLYNESRTPKSMILGSPEYLERNFRELDIEVRKSIDEYISKFKQPTYELKNCNTKTGQYLTLSANDAAACREQDARKVTDAKTELDFIIKSTAMQVKKTMLSRNSNNIQTKYEYEYKSNCDSRTGMYLRHKQSDADACKLQDKMKKRITQYLTDAKSYKTKYVDNITKVNIDSLDLNYRLFMIYMQNYAKRAYIEPNVDKNYLKNYTENFTDKLEINEIIVNFAYKHMNARYRSLEYKQKLKSKDGKDFSFDTILFDATQKKITYTNDSNITDRDEVMDLEKKIIEDYGLIKTVDVYSQLK